jgi:hypothetical protein
MDEGPRLVDLRVKYAAMEHQARRRLADLLAAGPEDGLARAEELYIGLPRTIRSTVGCGKHWHDSTSAETICWGSRLQCAGCGVLSLNWGTATSPNM